MEAHLLDGFIAPTLIPAILSTNLLKKLKDDNLELLYVTVGFGTIISAICALLQFHLNRYTRSRLHLTILTAILLTTTSTLSIIGFHLIRVNFQFKTYELPLAVRGQTISDGAAVFRYHFFSDLIPGIIILSQAQLCSMIKHDLLSKAKRSFTFGEASIIAQLASASYLTWALTAYSKYSGAGPFQVNLTTDIVLNIGFIIFSLVFLPAYLFLHGEATVARYALIGLSLSISYATAQSLIAPTSRLDPLTWLVDYIFSTHQRISLFSLWLSTLTACISFSTSWTRMIGQTNSLVRKIFHLAVCVVFISGYNQDIDFARFACGGMIIIMFLLEMIRAWQLKPIGHYLESVCQALRGKWDNKHITLSQIYLLIGTFLPLWLLPDIDQDKQGKLILSCGLISVGVGDTAAAIVGTFLGKTKLGEKSEKTLEGLLGNILSMILFKLIWVGYMSFTREFSFIIAAILTSVVEAITKTCDNLILPLVMILFIGIFQ